MKIITLCGSTKFKDEFEKVNAVLTLKGYIVLSVGVFPHADKVNLTGEQKTKLDDLHKRKIDLADEIFVIDVEGYIGNSTRSEIEYANRLEKKIHFLSKSELAV